jgi:lipopolysaccharide export system protein LptC
MLEDIEASVPVNEKQLARIIAKSAKFDRGTDLLLMNEPFQVTFSSGMVAKFQSANLNVPAGTMSSDDAASFTSEGASLVANSFKITDKGGIIIFDGRIRMTVDPAAFRAKNQ